MTGRKAPGRFGALFGALAAAAAIGAIAAAPASADPYRFLDLTSCCDVAGTSTPFTAALIGAAVNDNGDVAGTAVLAGQKQAYIFKGGQFTLLDALPTQNQPYGSGNPMFSGAYDLNDNDVVVGFSSDGWGQLSRNGANGGGQHPVAWRPFDPITPSSAAFDLGELETAATGDCGTAPNYDCFGLATNINASDDTGGYGEYCDDPRLSCFHTYPWTIPHGNRALTDSTGLPPQPSPPPDLLYYDPTHRFIQYTTTGINALDDVVVSPDPTSANPSAVCTSHGCTPIPFNASFHDGVRHAINDRGWVVGTDDSTGTAQVWENGAVVNLPPLPGDISSTATAINNIGDVVGASGAPDGCPSAVLWPAGKYNQPIDLNAAESTKTVNMLIAQDISETGHIVGQGGACSGGGYVANAHPWELVNPNPPGAKLTVTPAGSGVGAVTASPTGISCPGRCSHTYPLGMTVTLTATAAAKSTFGGWGGAGCTGTGTCVVKLTSLASPTTVTATFAGPPAPKCTLKPRGHTVLLSRHKTGKLSKVKPGTLTLGAKCNQPASGRLVGTLVALIGKKPKHGKHKFKTFSLGPARGLLLAGKTSILTVKVPSAAVAALKKGAKEAVTLTLVARSASGASGRASASLAGLKGLP